MNVDDKVEAEIDALLAHDNTASVIDALMSMPHMTTAGDPDGTWEKAFHARLQARLARRMREVLEEREEQSNSRNAA